ncbi:MAG TPA: bifunctional methylenetetrahydrofolate dehydrogenase/methenyltetrahydrofolate cyclohydrolase FolD [Acidocella sp.]|nr:MAG: bifunctional methylenetetrahydrofolate dehydrogenase/methenyltetrahydrofolate cyclohydrolase [Acidocella sp. 20-58-15]HQT39757.1 bifunctional methylenetetrahydrofolate dehydrogenase/methenyltetrahydrofolate cyclohydrolase FolD [Acidocella sp.]
MNQIETKIIDGKAFAAGLVESIRADVAGLRASRGIQPGLAVVLVGEDAASQVYVRNKAKQTVLAGMHSLEFKLPAETPEPELIALVKQLNADPKVHGILVQLPLPGHIDSSKVLDTINPDKDVDGFHIINAGRLAVGLPGLVPCTPLGCVMLLTEALGDLSGLNAVVVGRSNIVGKPVAQLLLAQNCTVTIAHSRSRNLAEICRGADILVAAVGRPEMIKGHWIKPGATVIDVGINRVPAAAGKTKLVGDVAFDEAQGIAGRITPVPGGVGPMTIACLLRNTLTAAKRIEGGG